MNQPKPTSVEELKQILLKRKITTVRFRLPWKKEEVYNAILASYMAEVEYRHRTFIPDEHTLQHIRLATEWLTADNPRFGMLLCGEPGNGKTTLALAIKSLVHYIYSNDYEHAKDFVQIQAREICDYAKNKEKTFKALWHKDMLLIDDLGTEPSEVLHYGNVLNPVIDLLCSRYDRQLFTIITTNLTPQNIREHYGNRVADRFNEMFERIVFRNSSYRITPNPDTP